VHVPQGSDLPGKIKNNEGKEINRQVKENIIILKCETSISTVGIQNQYKFMFQGSMKIKWGDTVEKRRHISFESICVILRGLC